MHTPYYEYFENNLEIIVIKIIINYVSVSK